MSHRLSREELVTIQVLDQKGQTASAIARQLQVTEGAVRYHLKRAAAGTTDGRGKQVHKAAEFAGAITAFIEGRGAMRRPPNVEEVYDHLVAEHGYKASYKSVLRYMRATYGPPRIRTYRRVETPPGAQTQTDWGEYPRVRLRGEVRPLHAFVMVLSHSRKPAVVWSEREDMVSWLTCHNEAYRRLGGVAAVNRIDNVKTGVSQGAGSWGTIHPTYRTYSTSMGFHVDACQPRQANAKGKAESKVRLSRLRVDPSERDFSTVGEIQTWTDDRVEDWSRRAICPATGTTVAEAWAAERPLLRTLPDFLPEPFDVVVTRPVHRDCMVYFEDRQYPVPFTCVGRHVEVRGCASKVQILFAGAVIREYPRRTAQRILIDPTCYEGEATDLHLPPPPLGRMGKRLEELSREPVLMRSVDFYAALAEVAR